MRRKYPRRTRKPVELMLVPMIDIFTVLVTFLLMTAVFSRITIMELDLPAADGAASSPTFRLEVIVRHQGLELTNGRDAIARIANVDGEYDLKTLSRLALSLKRDYPKVSQASVLLEPDIEYDHLIQVMDAIRSAELPAAGEDRTADPEVVGPRPLARKVSAPRPPRVALFTDISVGDAP